MMPVHFALYSDAERYDTFNARVDLPILIFQGRQDTAVDPATVERWAAPRPNVTLRLLDDDHQLLASLETIWLETAAFLGIRPARPSLPPDAALPI
jgi:surfactin synthase thioesterase subunit